MRHLHDDDLLAGRDVPGEPALSSFLAALRSTAHDEPPAPSAALAALLRDGLTPGADGTVAGGAEAAGLGADGGARVVDLAERSRARRPGRRTARRAGAAAAAALVLKVGIGAAAAAAAVVGTAQLDGAPAVVREPARAVVGAVVDAWHGVTGVPASPAPVAPSPSGPAAVPVEPVPACGNACPDPGAPSPAPTPAAPGAGEERGRSEDAPRPAVPGAPVLPEPAPADAPGGAPQDAPGQDGRPTAVPTPRADVRDEGGAAGRSAEGRG
ncbi:hypothetical protein [Cellulomonas fimi]|uniref:hypothetical protein n=1 Tax=Cellulomonas fimi TaxID=1708 RepID=UPI000F8293C0|nr:hypothetical protein [Cellulomonas fimi]